jgi:hypothetical protein
MRPYEQLCAGDALLRHVHDSGVTTRQTLRRCGVPTKTGKPCQNPIKEGQATCWQPTHRYADFAVGGSSPRRATITRGSGTYRTPRVQAQTMRPPRVLVQAARISRYEEAVKLTRRLATQGWQATAAGQLSDVVGHALWSKLDQRWRANRCLKLAAIANKLRAVSGGLNILDETATRAAGGPALLARAARILLSRGISLHLGVTQSVHVLRTTGIVLCALHGELDECACLKDMVDEIGLPRLQGALKTTLIPYFTS